MWQDANSIKVCTAVKANWRLIQLQVILQRKGLLISNVFPRVLSSLDASSVRGTKTRGKDASEGNVNTFERLEMHPVSRTKWNILPDPYDATQETLPLSNTQAYWEHTHTYLPLILCLSENAKGNYLNVSGGNTHTHSLARDRDTSPLFLCVSLPNTHS